MAVNTLIMGESGSGKSSSIRTLNPQETYIINILDKPLPFRGFKKNYVQKVGGNYFSSTNHNLIKTVVGKAAALEHVKTIIIDDFQYMLASEFMNRATERGFDKFTEIAQHAWDLVLTCQQCRPDLNIFFLSHTENNSEGIAKCKTIGKMLDEKVTLEGMFTVVLHAFLVDDSYKFLTQHDGRHIAKSPMGMFDDKLIVNDLQYVIDKMNAYYQDELL